MDTSVALAQLLAEDRCPPAGFWNQDLIASRLLEYEIWNAIHRRRLGKSHGEGATQIIETLAMAEMGREILRRATEPFRTTVRTLDALHLATMLFLRDQGVDLRLASYDQRMIDAARSLRIDIVEC